MDIRTGFVVLTGRVVEVWFTTGAQLAQVGRGAIEICARSHERVLQCANVFFALTQLCAVYNSNNVE